jgi:hypothetical protein
MALRASTLRIVPAVCPGVSPPGQSSIPTGCARSAGRLCCLTTCSFRLRQSGRSIPIRSSSNLFRALSATIPDSVFPCQCPMPTPSVPSIFRSSLTVGAIPAAWVEKEIPFGIDPTGILSTTFNVFRSSTETVSSKVLVM